MLKLIVFDMDGVIVDTEYLDFQLQQEIIKSISKEPDSLTREDFSELVGRSGEDLLSRIKALSQSDLSFDEIAELLETIEAEKYQHSAYFPRFRTDMIAILEYAKANQIFLAVASSTGRKHIEEILKGCGIAHYFDHVASGEDFSQSKPHPDIYLSVLDQFALAGDQAVTVEDSPSGIAAGKSAGLHVIAYEEKRMTVDQSQADVIAEDMKQVLQIIKSLNK